MHLELLIFDLDGTVADTLPVCFEAFRDTYRQFLGRAPDDDELHESFGPSEEGVLANTLGADRAEEALEVYLRAYRGRHSLCAGTFEGIPALLDGLAKRNIRTAIVTGKGPHSAAISLELLGLAGAFPRVEAGSPAGNCKREAIARVLADFEVAPGAAAYLGDHPSDVREARAAGITTLSAAWASTAEVAALEAERPDRLFTRVDQLEEWLRGCTAPGDPLR